MDDVSSTGFSIEFDGPALVDGQMPVKDLAPALLALGELFATASAVLEPDKKPAALSIKATSEGSFDVHLLLEGQSVWRDFVNLFSSDGVTAIANLRDMVILGGAGVFWLIQTVRGRGIVGHENVDQGMVRLTLADGTTIEVPVGAWELFKNVEVRKQARQVVEPLAQEGIEELRFAREERVTVTVDANDVRAFDLPDDAGRVLTDQESRLVLQLVNVSFEEGKRWRVSDGDRTFPAKLDDSEFLGRVNRSVEDFRKGDLLECDVRTVQRQKSTGLSTEHTIVRVLQHMKAPQLPLDD